MSIVSKAWASIIQVGVSVWGWLARTSTSRFHDLRQRIANPPYEDGRAHVSTTPWVSILLVVSSLVTSSLIYGWLMHAFQSELHKSVLEVPVVREILNPTIGEPLRPLPTVVVSRKAVTTPEDRLALDYADQFAVTPEQWLKVLIRLGLVDEDRELKDFVGKKSDGEDLAVQDLISKLQKAAGTTPLDKVTPLTLLTHLATLLDGASLTNGTDPAPACWEAAIAQALAGFPGRWERLADSMRDSRRSVRSPSQTLAEDETAATDKCVWNGVGELNTQPNILTYAFAFAIPFPNEVDVVRTLFEGTGALREAHTQGEFGQASNADLSAMTTASSSVSPTTALAERFGRLLLSAAQSSPDVRGARIWVDSLAGPAQAILNWFFFMLLFFVGARMWLFRQLRKEIESVTRWLASPAGQVFREATDDNDVSKDPIARDLAEALDRIQKKGVSPEGYPAGRRESLILLMAEKAIRRLIVGEPQPELFRDFCAARRAMVDESAWLLRYLSRALPALGFIGTILGILLAMNGADGIVRAADQAERAAAMTAVTSPLAFAFAHTFLALIAGLITGYWIDRQTAAERVTLMSYEEALVEKIDVAERVTTQTAATPQKKKRATITAPEVEQ